MATFQNHSRSLYNAKPRLKLGGNKKEVISDILGQLKQMSFRWDLNKNKSS